MKTLIKTLAVLTTGVGAVAVVKRVSEKIENLNYKTDSTNGSVNEALSMATEAKVLATEALDKADAQINLYRSLSDESKSESYKKLSYDENVFFSSNGNEGILTIQNSSGIKSTRLFRS